MPFFMKYMEVDLLTSYLKSEHSVLEVGSGGSTIEFAKTVKKVVSLEHHSKWYRKISRQIKRFDNVTYVLKEPNKKWNKRKSDGDYESFKDYIDYLSSLKDEHFDIIFIDGRARRDCMLALGKDHPNAFFFMHDFFMKEEQLKVAPTRRGYLDVLDEFDLIELKRTLAVFKYKKQE